MKKIYFLLAGILLFAAALRAQDTTSYYGKMNYIYAHLDKNQISSGILRDYGIDFLNLDNFTGAALNDSNYVSLDEWRMLYTSLYSAQINTTSMLYLDTLNNLLKKNSYSNQPIAITALYYKYQSLKSNALTGNLFTVSNDQLYDVPGRTQSPYQDNELFAVAPIRQGMLAGNSQIVFKPELIFGNTGKTISAIAVDVNNSGSWQNATLNTPFNLSFSAEGFYPISIRFTFTDNSIKYAHSKIAVYPNPDAIETLNNQGLQTNNFSIGRTSNNEPVTADKSYLGLAGQGDITIQYAINNSTGQIRKPLIIAEGFDPTDGYGFRQFINSITYNDNQVPAQYISLNQGLDDINDYDLIFLNYKSGADYIQRNAYLLEKVIALVNTRKTTYNGVRQDNVILGLSMGGLVVRYALRDMEINNLVHETRLSIGHDTPYWGANVPVGAQAAVQSLSSFSVVNVGGKFPFIKWVDLFPGIPETLDQFNTPAAKQLLIQRYLLNPINYSLTANNSAHNNFYNELNSMGWPVNCKNVTISNGTCNGTAVFPNNSRIFELIGGRSMSYFGSLWRSAALTVGTVVSPIVIFGGNINSSAFLAQFPLGLFSTKSSINLDFRINSVPQSGISELYRGDVYSIRKILGFINVNTYFMKTHVNSTGTMLPLDNAPGGVYDLNEFGFDSNVIQSSLPAFFSAIPAIVLQPRFCFVPTVSSLSISSPQQNLFANLCNNLNCLTPSAIKASYVPQQNQLHISYTQESSNFLLQWQDQTFNCPKICASNLSIQGPSQFCASQTYTIFGLPSGTSIAWSASPTGVVNINSSGNSVTLTKTNNGSISLTANITSPCGNTSVSKEIVVGTPNPSVSSYVDRTPQSSHYQYVTATATQIPGTVPSNYSWYRELNGNSTFISSGLQLVQYGIPPCSVVYYKLVANTPCGDAIYNGYAYNSYCSSSKSATSMAIYPSPASTEVNISNMDAEGLKRDASNIEGTTIDGAKAAFQVKLYDRKGNLIRSAKNPKGSNGIKLNVAEVPNGTYFLHVVRGKETIKQQIIISH